MKRRPVDKHPGITQRRWTDAHGRDQARYDATYRGPDRREHAKSFLRLGEAERWLRDQRSQVDRGTWLDTRLGQVPVAKWAERWLAGRTSALKPKTAEGYASLLRSRILPTFGMWALAAIRPSDVQAWLNRMVAEGVSASRIRQAHVVLSLLYRSAVRDGLVATNPALDADLPRLPSGEAPYLEPPDVDRLARSIGEPYGLMVRIMGTLGLRYGEAAALRRRSADLLRRRLLVEQSLAEVGGALIFGPTKTHAGRRVPLTPMLAGELEDRLERLPPDPDVLVFPAPAGGALRHSNFYHRVWQPALGRCGLPRVGVHVLRHSAAAALIASGASPKAVQSILGHRSAAFTLSVYGHLFDADLDDVAARLGVTVADRVRNLGGIAALPGAATAIESGR